MNKKVAKQKAIGKQPLGTYKFVPEEVRRNYFLRIYMKKNIDKQMIEMLERDNHKLREAGFNLAKSAINVVEDYDGLHRLSRAVADWFLAISNQGDRGEN